MERFLYLYNPDTGEVGDSHDITDVDEAHAVALKAAMLVTCKMPWEVIDSKEAYFPLVGRTKSASR